MTDVVPLALPVLDTTIPLAQQIDATKQLVKAEKLREETIRYKQPIVRFWDSEWRLQHVGGSEIKATFSFISNDTGPGQVELPFDGPIAQWIHDHQGRIKRGEGRNVCITVDYCGARWSGIMDKYVVEQREDGDVVLVVDFLHDYEHLKWIQCWSNPWLPAAIQAPRAWIVAGPVTWILKMTLLANVARSHNPFITWPDDPLDLDNWLPGKWLDVSKWPLVVKPESFMSAMSSGVVWGVATSRWATWHDMAHTMLEDAELSVRCDRWLEGDPPPWPGAKLRSGALVIDIVDKSGVYVGTSHGGNVFDGLIRTVTEFADDFIDSTENLIDDVDIPAGYYNTGNKYTDKALPYVIYREGDTSAIQTSQWINSPAKGIQVNVGGRSMPGVNEAISACVAPDTLIDGPDGKERIDVLAAHGEPFRVWSITPEGKRVAALAESAFRKGYAEQFAYTLDTGQSITVTKDHRFLTPSGFVRAAMVSVGDRVCVTDWSDPEVAAELRAVSESEYVGLEVPAATVTSVDPVGWDYFYDMHVPGWENYSAAGIWNHNTIQAVGDLWGNIVMIGGLGGSIDALMAPLYQDVFLAWQSVTSNQRSRNSGWERLFEYFQQGASQAYTISSLMVLRAGFWATKTTISWKAAVSDGMPWMVGDHGVGHFFLDDRVGLVLKGDSQIHMDRCRKIDLAWDEQSPPEWQISIGDDRNLMDPAQRAFGKIEALIAGLRDMGVWLAVVIAGASAATGLAVALGSQPASTAVTASAGTDVGVLRSELVASHTVRLDRAPAVAPRLDHLALDFSADISASTAHAASIRADVGVLGSPLMSANAMRFTPDSVSSVPDLVKSVLPLGAPGQVLQTVVGGVAV